MTIPSKTFKKWASLKQEGDIAELAKLIGKTEATVYRIFKTGEAKIEDAEKINGFYTDRQNRVDGLKNS